MKTIAGATSKTSLLRSSVESLAPIEVRRTRLTLSEGVEGILSSLKVLEGSFRF